MISKMLPWKTTVSLQEAKNKHVFEKQIHLDCKQGPKALWKSSPLDSGAHTRQLPFCSVHPTVRYRHFVGSKTSNGIIEKGNKWVMSAVAFPFKKRLLKAEDPVLRRTKVRWALVTAVKIKRDPSFCIIRRALTIDTAEN